MRVPGISQEETDTMAHGTHKTRDIIYINNKIMIYKDGTDKCDYMFTIFVFDSKGMKRKSLFKMFSSRF